MYLILLAIAPVIIIALYFYLRDKYEKEPIRFLIIALIAGCVIVIPIIYLENFLTRIEPTYSADFHAFYTSFVVAAFSEEIFKYLAFILLIWNNKNFNEKFDGIIYAVFIGLGFAMVENIMYVTNHGAEVGYLRAITAVPFHAIDGVAMGFHFGLAKFYPKRRKIQFVYALIIPIILHGIYDFILFSRLSQFGIVFLVYLVYLYIIGFKRINLLINKSIYRKIVKKK
jgi:protease PrsW